MLFNTGETFCIIEKLKVNAKTSADILGDCTNRFFLFEITSVGEERANLSAVVYL